MAEQERKFRKPRVRVEEKDEFEKKLISVRRVTKVVKGGKNMRLSALVVVGNKNGQVGMGINKAFLAAFPAFSIAAGVSIALLIPIPT